MLMISCNDDDDNYSLGKRWEALATVEPISDNSYYFVLDNGEKLGVAASNVVYIPKSGQRVYLNFTYLSDEANNYDHLIKVNWLAEILTKGVIDLTYENQDSIGNDPVKVHSLWIGDDYLNIHFGYNASGQVAHYINLVNNTTIDPNEDGKIHLEFRHNTNQDPQWYGRDSYVAFDLRPYKQEYGAGGKESVEFVIGVLDFNEEYKEYNVVYNFNNDKTDIRKSLTYDSDNDATLFR